jgi:hypothetical protein
MPSASAPSRTADDDDEFFEALEEPLGIEPTAAEPPPPSAVQPATAAQPASAPPRALLAPAAPAAAAAVEATFHITLPHPVAAAQPGARTRADRPASSSGNDRRAHTAAPSSQRSAPAADNPFLPSRYVPPPEPVDHKLLRVHETVEVGPLHVRPRASA